MVDQQTVSHNTSIGFFKLFLVRDQQKSGLKNLF